MELPAPRLNELQVIKEDGNIQPFSWNKLNQSLHRAHVEPHLCLAVGKHLSEKLPITCTTGDIRESVKRYLKKRNKYAAARYNLREAIMQLGPSGFPFERYIGFLLKELGYKVQVGKIVAGKCVSHEVDVIAEKDGQYEMIECKYHNRHGTRSDVKVAMYVWSRFEDIKEAWETKLMQSHKFHQGWLVTNTKITEDARRFAYCRGLKIMSWNYPSGQSLQDLVSQTCLYPITSLSSLTTKTVQELVLHDIVACKQLLDLDITKFGTLSPQELLAAKEEANLVCEFSPAVHHAPKTENM